MLVQRITSSAANKMDTAPAVELRQVSFVFEGEKEPVWHDISCEFLRGAVNVIAGPSGCGKSTLLQMICGVIPFVNPGESSGSVIVNGLDVTDEDPKDRCRTIGYVMQDPDSQFCTFTVEDEIAFGLENFGTDPEEMNIRIAEVLERVGLPGYEKRFLNDLSGGQKQKVAIASILAMEPEILLLDEPTANLDPESRREILNLLVQLASKKGMTIIMVEHNLEDIVDSVGHLVVMDTEGRIADSGHPDNVLKRLASGENKDLVRLLPPALWRKESVKSVWSSEENNSTEEFISFDDITFAYPLNDGKKRSNFGKPVLKDLNLKINRGDFLMIAGENGAGKSTLLNLLFLSCKPQSGRILMNGKDISTIKKTDLFSKMGLVFQNPELQFVTNQVDRELLYSLKKSGLSDDEKNARVHEMLQRFRLEQFADRSPFILSQGQKRRLSVATMLLTDQEILFLDEPTYGQDYENRQELMRSMVKLNRQGVTIVAITHDISLIREFGKRVVFLDEGRIVMDGDAEDYLQFMERRTHVQLY